MAKRGKKIGIVYESLASCLQSAPDDATGAPFEVQHGDKSYFIFTTSTGNAVRAVGYYIGLTAKPVKASQIIRALQGKTVV